MTHATLRELTDAVHGFSPRPDHVPGCGPCGDLESRLEQELALLRRADGRVARAPRRASFAPVAFAAAVLVAITVAIVLYRVETPAINGAQDPKKEPPTVEKLIQAALGGDADALKALRAKGPAILRLLVDARLAAGETKGSGDVSDLVFEFKKAAAADSELFAKLDAIQVTVDMSKAPLGETIDYFREVSGLNMAIDEEGITGDHEITINLNGATLRRIFDLLCLNEKLEYDLRCGVLLISTPERLWGKPKAEPAVVPLTENQVKAAREWIAVLAKESPEERAKACTELLKLGRAVVPLLAEAANGKDKAIAAHCKDLVDRLTPKLVAGAIPREGTWRSQKLAKADAEIFTKLTTMKIDLQFKDANLSDIIGFLRDFTGLNFVIEEGVEKTASVLKTKDLSAAHAIELLTLTHGLDVKIEGGVVVIFTQKK